MPNVLLSRRSTPHPVPSRACRCVRPDIITTRRSSEKNKSRAGPLQRVVIQPSIRCTAASGGSKKMLSGGGPSFKSTQSTTIPTAPSVLYVILRLRMPFGNTKHSSRGVSREPSPNPLKCLHVSPSMSNSPASRHANRLGGSKSADAICQFIGVSSQGSAFCQIQPMSKSPRAITTCRWPFAKSTSTRRRSLRRNMRERPPSERTMVAEYSVGNFGRTIIPRLRKYHSPNPPFSISSRTVTDGPTCNA